MKIIEAFNSFQGEGPDQGKIMTFLRFAKCTRPGNKPLCKWCDTMCKLKNLKEFHISYEDIIFLLEKTNYNLCITGGEPTLYNNEIENLLNHLYENDIYLNFLNIETNGYKLLNLIERFDNKHDFGIGVIRFIYSPKIFDHEDLDITVMTLEALEHLEDRVYVKLVIQDENDTEMVLSKISKKVRDGNLWVMPLGATIEEISKSSLILSKFAIKYKANISSRLHVIHGIE